MKIPGFVSDMNRKQKKSLYRILLAALVFIIALLIPAKGVLELLLFLIPYGIVGW